MKKYFRILLVILMVVTITGCKKSVVTKCSSTMTQNVSNYTVKREYTVYAKGDIVKKIEIKEVIDTKNNTIRAYFEKVNKDKYEEQNKLYGGTKYDVNVKDKVLTTIISVNYSKFDMNKYVKDNSVMKNYVDKTGKLTYKGAINMLEMDGLKCEK